jgi:predicted dienelactone hydrolase
MLKRMILVLTLLVLALPSLVFARELPMVTFPQPTGPWVVGRTVLRLVDETRLDTYTPDPHDHWELMVYVWYPADPALDAPAATWLGPEMSPVVADMYGLPPAFLDLVTVRALDGVPIADSASGYPVLLMSHGDSSHPLLYTAFAEELASHGHMVWVSRTRTMRC